MDNVIFVSMSIEELNSIVFTAVQKAINESVIALSAKPDADVWMDLKELCQYHPDKPSKPTVYGWVHAGNIPVHKGGKKLRFLKSEIDQWLKQ